MYAAGHSEELVGKAIAGLDRGSLFITSKVWKTHLHADDVLQAAENSLKRLKTDYMDLFLIHQVNPDIPLEDTMRGMDAVVKHGFARAIGVSNFSLQRFQKAQACTSNKLVLNQVHYNLVVRECEPQLLPWCQANDVMLEAWRPLRNLTPCPLMDEMREKYNATAAQIALAFLLQQKNVVTITAMRSVEHMPENLAALQLSLEEEDLERLRREFPGQLAVSPTVPL
jgi:diketogulonate reductase-like aldo/keto reductase